MQKLIAGTFFVLLSASSAFCLSVERQIQEMAIREYPDNPRMQQYVYDNQMAAYRYMRSVRDREVEQIALREHPNDFSMQKYTYDNQLAAKRYMATVNDREVLQVALREHPHDYSMQKHTYDNQLAAKRYMATVQDREVEQIALREAPYDYSMQKYTYDRQLSAKQYMNAQRYSQGEDNSRESASLRLLHAEIRLRSCAEWTLSSRMTVGRISSTGDTFSVG